jgi:hypothetical protein
VFYIRFIENIGEIKKIMLKSDSRGADWKVEKIEILKDEKDNFV